MAIASSILFAQTNADAVASPPEAPQTCLVGQPEWLWSMPSVSGDLPSERDASRGVVIHPESGQLWVFGGHQAPKPPDHCHLRDELYRAEFGEAVSWSLESDAAPGAITSPLGRLAPVALDTAADRLIVFGGYTECKPSCPNAFGPECDKTLDDLWRYSQSSGWRQMTAADVTPLGRYGGQTAFEPQTRRLYIHGGLNFLSDVVGDSWALELSDDPPAWRRLTSEDGGPGLRATAFHWLDSHRQLLIVAGGRRCFETQCPHNFLDDAWALSVGGTRGTERWWPVQLDAPMPTTFTGRGCAYDPVTMQGVCYGGHLRPLGPNDVWGLPNRELWAFQWTGSRSGSFRLVPTGDARPTVNIASLVYHPTLDAFIVFGGWNSGDKTYDELWIAERQCVPGPANRRSIPAVMP